VASERRGRARTPFDGWVELHTAGERRLATGRDLSAGGIGLVVSPDGLPQRANVTCEFALPGISLPMEVEGWVAWSIGMLVGVCFATLDPGLSELLENHVAGRF
jgi:PilZ domain